MRMAFRILMMILLIWVLLSFFACATVASRPQPVDFCYLYHPRVKDPPETKTHWKCRVIEDGVRVQYNLPFEVANDPRVFQNHVLVPMEYLEQQSSE